MRELIVLGTASQVPTRQRNHNGYVLRWDREGILFDPGEGSQRQMLHAGVAAHDLTRICVTHFHGDHSLGLAGVVQRINLDRVPHPVTAHYPASGQRYFDRLRYATAYRETADLREVPVTGDGPVAVTPAFTLSAALLSHPVESYGYRLTEPDGHAAAARTPGRARYLGARDRPPPARGRGRRRRPGGGQRAPPRPGLRLRHGHPYVRRGRATGRGLRPVGHRVDFLDEDAELAEDHGHLTAGQAAETAREAGVRHLVLTHFSQRYPDPEVFERQARAAGFTGELTVAQDLMRVPVPKRR